MTSNTDLTRTSFQLKGHDCLLGEHPSLAVPVGMLNGYLVAVFRVEQTSAFHPLSAGVAFQEHNLITASTLEGFDPLEHGLFALSPTDVVIYTLGEEKAFYSKLLRYSPAFYIDHFIVFRSP
jgi:hypothetical protein